MNLLIRIMINPIIEDLKIMKRRYDIPFLTFLFIYMSVYQNFICRMDAINSSYAVTTDYHGKIVLPGTLVTATAGTTDPDVKNVTFFMEIP